MLKSIFVKNWQLFILKTYANSNVDAIFHNKVFPIYSDFGGLRRASKIKGQILGIDIKPSILNNVQYTKNKEPIFNGYTNYKDANNGTNKKAFIVGASNIKIYNLNDIIKTDQGDYKVE